MDSNSIKKYFNGISVLQQNIRSLRKNFDAFVCELDLLKNLPNVIILTEIWIDESEVNFYNLPNYRSFVKCNSSYRSGGVVVFVSDKITTSQLDCTSMTTADCVHIKMSLPDNNVIELLAIYRLHEFSADTFIVELEDIISKIKSSCLMVNGDININILDKSDTVDNYIIKMASHGLKSLIYEPTRVTRYSKSCIDHVFFRNKVNNGYKCLAEVIKTCITDHWTTLAYIEYEPTNLNNRRQDKEYSKIDIELLKVGVANEDWSAVFTSNSACQAFNIFMDKLNDCITKSYVTVKIKSNYRKPWMNGSIKKNIDLKNRLYKDCVRSPDDTILEQIYKHHKNALVNQIRNAKQLYYENLFTINKKDSRSQWRLIKELTGEKQKDSSPIVLKGDGDQVLNEPIDVANRLNEFFCSVADKLR
jgi:hypothetical protein